MLRSLRFAALVLFLFAPPATAQQGAGAIAGTVRDASGAVMPGVTVEASSPALIEKVRTGVTDGRGAYRIVDLRPGTYVVTFTLAGFATVRREGIQLSEGFTAAVNVDMRVGALEETLTVTGASPVVDVQSTQQATVVTREALTTIPTAQYFAMVANLMPGVQGAGSGGSQDVGGNTGFGSVRMGIHGGRIRDQQLYQGGFSIERAGGDGTTNVVPIEGSIEEYNMGVSSHSAEAETGGVRVSIVNRSGGNQFSGGVYFNWAGESLQSDNLTPGLEAQGLTSTTSNKLIYGFSPSFGGPIKKDKLWFYTALGRNVVDQYVASNWSNANKSGWVYEPDLSRPAVQDQNSIGANVRLTYQLNDKNRFTGYFEQNFLCACHLGLSGNTAPEASTRADLYNYVTQASWSAPITDRLLLEAGFGRMDVNPYVFGSQPDGGPFRVTDAGIGYTWGVSNAPNRYLARVDHFKSSLTYGTGAHNLKMGVEMRNSSQQNHRTIPSGDNASYRLVNGRPDRVTYATGPFTRENYADNLGLFVQDRWTVARLTADVGLRFDWLRTSYPDQTVEAAQYRPSPFSFSGAEVLNWKDLNPRLGAVYDLFGNGKTAIKGNLSRYVIQETVTITADLNPVTASNATTTRSWTDNGDFIIQGDPLNPARNGELGPGSNATFGQPGKITTRIDPNFAKGFGVRPYQWELSAGVERELLPGVALDVAYFRRMYGKPRRTQNVALSPSNYDPYCVTAPVDARLPDGGGYEICGLYDLNRSAVGLQDNVITSTSRLSNESEIERWNGLDVLVKTRLPRGIILQGGTSTGKTLTDNCAVVAQIGDASGNPSPLYCRNETPFLTSLRMSGAYPLPWNMQVSAAFQSNPGPAITASGTFTNSQIAPTLGRALSSGNTATVELVAPGTLYAKRSNQLDVRFTKNLRIGRMRWQGTFDLYNALNASPVMLLNNTYGTVGAAWQRPTRVLAPRLLKFGIRMDF